MRHISFAPKPIAANGYTVPKDSIDEPFVSPVGTPQKINAGTPEINPANLNVHAVGQPTVIPVGAAKVFTPGTGGFSLPEKIPAIGKIKPAGIPEIVNAAEAATKEYNPANFAFYKPLQGLKYNNVTSMLHSKTGNLWFGSNNGLCRFDGKSFAYFTDKEGFTSNAVLSVSEDRKGNLWIGTRNGGLFYYDGNLFTHFTEKEGLTNNTVYSVLEDRNGNCWFGTQGGGLYCYDGKSFTNYTKKQGLPCDSVYSVIEDKTGNLWIGTYGGGVSRFDGKSFANYTQKEGLPNNFIYAIVEDNVGNLWFGTDGSGVCRYDGKSFTCFTEENGLSDNSIYCIMEDKTGSLWFGTSFGGVCRYDNKTLPDGQASLTTFMETEGLSSNIVLSMLEDKSGNLWFGTYSGGVNRYNGKSFTNYTNKEGLSNNTINAIAENTTTSTANAGIWFGTFGSGACFYDGQSFTNYTEENGLISNSIFAMATDKRGNTWIGTLDGLSCFDGKTFINYGYEQMIATRVYSILEEKSGNLWFGTGGNGVSCYDGKSFTQFTESQGLIGNTVLAIAEDKNGILWFGTNNGISRFDNKSRLAGQSGFINFTSEKNLGNSAVYSILADRNGGLWFGTTSGVYYYNGKSFVQFTEKEGLSNDAVLSIWQDVEGSIWLGTRKGLSKISPRSLAKLQEENSTYNPLKEAFFYNYDYNDGFLGLSCRRNSVFQDSKGKIWWGADLLTCHNPKDVYVDTTAPVVNLTGIKLFGEEIYWSNLNAVTIDSTGKKTVIGKANDTLLSNGILLKDITFDGLSKWYSLPEHLSLPYNNSNITFGFIGVHMQSRHHIRYQYKIEGLDRDWSSVTDRTEAPYGNLPAGDYIFKVKAMNQSGVWSVPFEFKFEVRPPWWQTWWFRTLVAAFIIISSYVFYRWRTASLRRTNEKLEYTVELRTVEVKKEKLIVQQQKELIEEKHKEITDSISYAERIQKSFLATKELLDENLNDYFVFFRPKGVVSGDFYWAGKLANDNFAYVTADSTGHGVPGAIMSILNISSLELAVKEGINEPDQIFNYTRTEIINRLKKDGSEEGGKDGMDASIVILNKERTRLEYAAANNPVWIVRKNELIELSPDKMPIGKHDKDSISFTKHAFDLMIGDVIYTFSDGIADQFGGSKGKKFLSKQLKEILLSIAHEPMEIQKQKLSESFDNWKGILEQVDDVTLIGVRV
ncbi:MAG: two-component regulator propeller domain-containing protein [Bacteroidia bacterium]